MEEDGGGREEKIDRSACIIFSEKEEETERERENTGATSAKESSHG